MIDRNDMSFLLSALLFVSIAIGIVIVGNYVKSRTPTQLQTVQAELKKLSERVDKLEGRETP